MVKDDATQRTDWERVVLDRLRERLEREDRERPPQAGWETAAEQRLRAHFEGAD